MKTDKENDMKHETREAWLNHAALVIRDHFSADFQEHFGDKGREHLDNLLVSAGFPSKMGLTKRIGGCWAAEAAGDKIQHHIFINPRLEGPIEVIATLAHEMVHAADNGDNGHKGPFVRMVRDMGLEGKATATVAGEDFKVFAGKVVEEIGDYPHVKLVALATAKKTQTTRMLKLEATCCGYVARTTKKWLEVGVPSCPCGNEMEVK